MELRRFTNIVFLQAFQLLRQLAQITVETAFPNLWISESKLETFYGHKVVIELYLESRVRRRVTKTTSAGA